MNETATSGDLTPERLDEVERRALEAAERAAKATPGKWKLWGMDVYADQDGTSNVETAVRVADTFFRNERGQFRTNDATFIAHAREDVPALSASVLALSAEVRRLREQEVRASLMLAEAKSALRGVAESQERTIARATEMLATMGITLPERASGEQPRAEEPGT